ncbi:MAG: hypothetical protein H0Z28_11610 [Archaeoglobus sp.]|nr:hypothetical protein [Archaeoglobus sp.]
MIILRYDEIALKSKFVRKRFEDTLVGNVKRVIEREFGEKARIKRDYGRIYVLDNRERIAKRISKVFGIAGVEIAEKFELDLEKNAIEIAERWKERVKGKSFAVRVRRTGEHNFTSMDAARIIGGKLKELTNSRVDLKNPEVVIQVEIRDEDLYLVDRSFPGYGGLPVGTQERVLSVLSDEKSLLSTWFALKRGCDVDVLVGEKIDLDPIKFWAAYRKIDVIMDGIDSSDIKTMLEKAYGLDYKGVYASITAEELESVYETLLKRNKPVYMPLLPLDQKEIYQRLKVVVEEAKNGTKGDS